jgi:hypothetical protein
MKKNLNFIIIFLFASASCYLPPTHERFINEMNSIIGRDISILTRSTGSWKRKQSNGKSYDYFVNESNGCRYKITTTSSGIITSWEQMSDPCRCLSGGLQQMQ